MLPLDREILTLGRNQADILLDDPRASGLHAEIAWVSGKHRIRDLESTNGLFINQKKLKEAWLTDQDVIEIGSTTFCYFQDRRDFHGDSEELTQGRKLSEAEKQEFQDVSRVTEWSTTSKKLPSYRIELELIDGEKPTQSFSFQKMQISIGRSGCDISLPDVDLSRKHCVIEVLSRSSIFLKDMNSTNGTFLNGERVNVSRLQAGDLIGLGGSVLKFSIHAPNETE